VSESSRWSFALSWRWFGYLVFVVIFAIACGFLSNWQFDRREEKASANERVAANFDAEPVAVDEVLGSLDAYTQADEWRPVELHGQYLADGQLLARARPRNGYPGFEILTPFQLDDGRVFIVNRGWIPTGSEQDYPDAVPAPPSGHVTVVARLKAGERSIPGRSAPPGQIATIHLPTFADKYGADRTFVGAYGLLAFESPPAETGELVGRPVFNEGNHLSYALQWIVFAVIAVVALGLAVRNEYRLRNPDDPRVKAAKQRAERRKKRRKPTDAEEEDALLDASSA